MSQLVFIAKDGKTLHLPFRKARWTVEKIREPLKERGVSPDQIVVFANNEDEDAEMKVLTDELVPKGKDLEVTRLSSMVPRSRVK
jgi:predicted RNA-binding protein with PUA domain